MTVSLIPVVNCDGCGDPITSDGEPGDTATYHREMGRHEGWHRRPCGRDICPNCWGEGVR